MMRAIFIPSFSDLKKDNLAYYLGYKNIEIKPYLSQLIANGVNIVHQVLTLGHRSHVVVSVFQIPKPLILNIKY